MYCTPCARFTTSITPNTSVRPAAIRNSSTPSCTPFSTCTSSNVMRSGGPAVADSLLQPALRRELVSVAGEHALPDLRLEGAIRPLSDLHEVEVLDRVA